MDERIRELLTEGFEHCLGGRVREAAAAWEQVLRLDPGNERARGYLQSLLGGGRPMDPPTVPRGMPAVRPPGERTPTPPQGAGSEADRLLDEARQRHALNDFSGAIEVLERALALDPNRADARAMHAECVETLTRMYESRIGSMEGVPELAIRPDEVIWLNLDHRAGFVLSQVDGRVSYDDLFAVCGMSRLETARILATLLGNKVIRTRGA